jgi:Early transcription elongation factor of RNA pol II, NGN section
VAVQAGEEEEAVDQHSLLPAAASDPKLWMVKCVAGAQREIVAQLMSKYIAYMQKDRPLGIFSAFCHDAAPSARSIFVARPFLLRCTLASLLLSMSSSVVTGCHAKARAWLPNLQQMHAVTLFSSATANSELQQTW